MKNEILFYALKGISRAFVEGFCANVLLPLYYLFIIVFREVKRA